VYGWQLYAMLTENDAPTDKGNEYISLTLKSAENGEKQGKLQKNAWQKICR